jgi:nucleotide-binding universal stress UspA family protein
MDRTIAVGYDGSEQSRAAVRWALAHAGEDAEVVVVTVARDGFGLHATPAARRRARVHLDGLLAALGGERLRGVVTEGRTAEALVAAAHRAGADELVVAAHRPGRAYRSDVVAQLLARADCAVTVVPT